jgi:hypothetical protein
MIWSGGSGSGMRMSRRRNENDRPIKRALELVTEALDLLDAYDGPADAAAHLSLAQERLRQIIRHSPR